VVRGRTDASAGKTLAIFGNKFPFSFHGTFTRARWVLAGFNPQWLDLNLTVAGFGYGAQTGNCRAVDWVGYKPSWFVLNASELFCSDCFRQ
jgi:hypothetical protein